MLMFLFCLQAKALYDFDGDTESGELSFTAGDTLFIVEQVRKSDLMKSILRSKDSYQLC